MTDIGLIAVTGATGAIGGRVARHLSAAGLRQRLIVREEARAPRLDGSQVAVATYDDPAALKEAMAGADLLFFVSGSEAPDRLAQHRNVVAAAAAAGVGHVVYTSFLGAGPACTFTFGRDHFHTEEAIRSAGLGHTFLRDSLYLDFLPYFAAHGELRAPAGDGHVAPVARDDVARVATTIIGDPAAHDGRTYDLTGPDRVSMADAAAILSRRAARPIPYIAETLEEAYASRAKYDAPDWEVRGWVTSYAAIAEGELDVVNDNVEAITGSRAVGIEEWLEANPEAWAHLQV